MAGVVTLGNDDARTVIFDGMALELSEQSCSIVYPDSMNKGSKVAFTEKTVQEVPNPTIGFALPAHVYAGDSVEVEPSIYNADSVT